MSALQQGRGAGIPRLQELTFLEVAATQAGAGATFDGIRRALIEHMIARREADAPSGNTAVFHLATDNEYRYLDNATEALAELMRLGLITKAQLPSTKSAAGAYKRTTFTLTPMGEAWVARLAKGEKQGAYDMLMAALWRCHPQFSGYLRLLSKTMFTVPTANWTEVHRTPVGEEGRHSYILFLASRAARAIQAGVTGWSATEPDIVAAIEGYLQERIAFAERRRRPNPYPRHRDFIAACEEALVTFAFRQGGLQVDYISHEILRRWTKELGVANFSYHVPLAPALRLWATADLLEEDGVPRARRRTVAEWADRIIAELPEAFERARRLEPGNSWVPIYRVRAAVCSKLGLNDSVFNAAVRQFLKSEQQGQRAFRLNLDSAEFGSIPPTEQPLRIEDASGRQQVYRVMTLIPLSERSST